MSSRLMSSSRSVPPKDLRDLARALRFRVRGDVYLSRLHRGIYATDASIHQEFPAAVVCPRSVDDVAETLAIARDRRVPILPRGAGTSLAGQTTTHGIVLDFTRYLDAVVAVDAEERTARVQPGVVRDRLNAAIAGTGLLFAPETSTSNRATIGGMIGNNSSGMMSIRYGRTSESVRALKLLLANGDHVLADDRPGAATAHALFAKALAKIQHRAVFIADRWPKVLRRVGGYSLDELLKPQPHFGRFFCGSEGTLAVVTEATVTLVPKPRAIAMTVAHFSDFLEALRTVPAIVAHAPLSVELMDRRLLDMSRDNPATRALCGFLKGEPETVLTIECNADTMAEATARIAALKRAIASAVYAFHDAESDAERLSIHEVRKLGLGVALRMIGDAKPVSFIEDACVPVEHLADYMREIMALTKEEGFDAVTYGHASVGVLHFKPILNLKSADHLARMDRLSTAACALVKRFGGSWSGEHGDGILRGAKNPQFWGEDMMALFREIKSLFDPSGTLNPGKIVDTPPITALQRYGPEYRAQWQAQHFNFRDVGGFGGAVELCNGTGACRKIGSGTMCPSYMATRDETHSTRGRANALRLAMSGQLGPDAMTGKELRAALDLCLECKACKSECPSTVDMARMKSEVLAAQRKAHGASAADVFFAYAARAARRTPKWMAPLLNALMTSTIVRSALNRYCNLASDRRLPKLASRRLRIPQRVPAPGAERVHLFVDTWSECYEPHVAESALAVLAAMGFDVRLRRAGCCGRPLISRGFLDEAKSEGLATLRRLDRLARRRERIVVLEPSCWSALVDDLPDLSRDAEIGERMKRALVTFEAIVGERLPSLRLRRRRKGDRVLLHTHCHQRALEGTRAVAAALRRAGIRADILDSGCCGMAGSFGYEAHHAELSRTIAEDRLAPAIRNAPQATVIASGFSCRHQIAEVTGSPAKHLAVFLAERLRR